MSIVAVNGASAMRAAATSPVKPMSAALPGSSQTISAGSQPTAANASQASEIVPLSRVAAAINVQMGMTNPDEKLPLALIAGPTASGKTALALHLATTRDVTIINADSAQVYAALPVLSAQPSRQEMASAPHKLFGYLDGDTACSAAAWAADAKVEIAAAHDAGRLPVLVGGTGLYLRTLLQGIAPIPEIDPVIRANIRALSTQDAHFALHKADPDAASALAPTDSSRIKRALEVIESTGMSILEWHKRMEGGIIDGVALRPLLLLPPRDWLHTRCDLRFEQMMERGAVEEVEGLLARNLPPDAPVMRAIGVPEIAAMLAGDITREEAIARGQAATRQYAKRQYTWFRNQSPADWSRWDGEINDSNLNKIEILLQ
jgi:tRNA dimethylallyltransferase